MSKLSVLMTVYNEADFIEYAIKACLPYVDHLVIVEGAYLQTVRLGAAAESTDGTKEIIQKFLLDPKVTYMHVNKETDKDHRNAGLSQIKIINPDGWFMIIDGDEIYEPNTFQMIKSAIKNMERNDKYAAYFKSFTFVNDHQHYTEQEFPRLFKVTPGAEFVDDNFVTWKDKNVGFSLPHVIKIPYIYYHHYSFCKGSKRFKLKRDWWMNRGLGADFDYGWNIDESGKITDPNHQIYTYNGRHPEIMKTHPMWNKDK